MGHCLFDSYTWVWGDAIRSQYDSRGGDLRVESDRFLALPASAESADSQYPHLNLCFNDLICDNLKTFRTARLGTVTMLHLGTYF